MAVQKFLLGFNFLRIGLQFLASNRRFWPWALIPWVFDLTLFILGFLWGANHLSIWATEILLWILPAPIESWTNWMMYPLVFLFWIAFLVLLIYAVYVVGLLIAAPFMGFMAEGILKKLGLHGQMKFFAMIKAALLKTFVFVILGVILLICSFIPALNMISSFCAFLILAFDSMDYTFEARGFSFSERLRFFFNQFPAFLGMASALSLTLLIPGLTLIVLPFAVAGSALIHRELK